MNMDGKFWRGLGALVLLLMVCIPAAVQAQDKVTTVHGDVYTTKVRQITKDQIVFDQVHTGYNIIDKLPRGFISSIAFADGAEIKFAPGGELIRDGLLQAPTMKAKTDGIYAESFFKLTEDETVALIGSEKYNLFYKPALTRTKVSISQLITGGLLFASGVLWDNKEVVYRDQKGGVLFSHMWLHGQYQLQNPTNYKYFKGDINPYLVGAEILGVTTIVSGIVNLIGSNTDLTSVLRPDIKLPSMSEEKVKLWSGVGMMALGTGAIAGGIADMASKSHWYWDLWEEGYSTYRHNIKEGEPPVAGPILALAGSVLVNIGLTEFFTSCKTIKGGATVRTGIAPGGYAMIVSF